MHCEASYIGKFYGTLLSRLLDHVSCETSLVFQLLRTHTAKPDLSSNAWTIALRGLGSMELGRKVEAADNCSFATTAFHRRSCCAVVCLAAASAVALLFCWPGFQPASRFPRFLYLRSPLRPFNLLVLPCLTLDHSPLRFLDCSLLSSFCASNKDVSFVEHSGRKQK